MAKWHAPPALALTLLISKLRASGCYQPFSGVTATRLLRRSTHSHRDGRQSIVPLLEGERDGGVLLASLEVVAVDEWLRSKDRTFLAFGTYAGDFNTFEYMQCLRHYLPMLRDECGIDQFAIVVNTTPRGGQIVADLLELPGDQEESHVEVWVDNTGSLARRFNVSRGWLPDAASVPPWVKLAGMMPWGLGAPATFGAILEGYVGIPPGSSGSSHKDLDDRLRRRYSWIQDAFAVGRRLRRWPDSIVEVDPSTGQILHSKFDDFWFDTGPLWPLRPLEKATLRLQTMLGITLRHWKDVMPNSEALRHGVLTQLGGCAVFYDGGRRSVFEHRDAGCCAIVDFDDMIRALKCL